MHEAGHSRPLGCTRTHRHRPHEAAVLVREGRELDLQCRLPAARAARKDVDDEPDAVHDARPAAGVREVAGLDACGSPGREKGGRQGRRRLSGGQRKQLSVRLQPPAPFRRVFTKTPVRSLDDASAAAMASTVPLLK